MIVQINKYENGQKVDVDSKHLVACYASVSSPDLVVDNANVLDYGVVNPADLGDSREVTVVYGPRAGSSASVDESRLQLPNIFPCLTNKEEDWLFSVKLALKNKLSKDICRVIDNVLDGRDTLKTSIVNASTDPQIQALTTKALADILQPYLGPYGLALTIKLVMDRIKDEEENKKEKA